MKVNIIESKSMQISAKLVTIAYTEVINPIKHMSATLNYKKYATPSLSTYPRLNHYNASHIIKGIWVPLPLHTLATLHRRHIHLVIVVAELVRPALTKGYQIRFWLGFGIRLVMIGVELAT